MLRYWLLTGGFPVFAKRAEHKAHDERVAQVAEATEQQHFEGVLHGGVNGGHHDWYLKIRMG